MGYDTDKDVEKQNILTLILSIVLVLLVNWLFISFCVWLFCWAFSIPYLMSYGFRVWIIYMVWAIFFRQKGDK